MGKDRSTQTASEAIEMPEWGKHFPDFVKFMTSRLDIGYHSYGDINFSNNILDLLQGMREELCDVANHAYITDVRIKQLMSAIRTTLGDGNEVGAVLDTDPEGRSSGEQGQE